ncbi:MAG: polyphosphate kinase 2 family protein [Pseudomonadales bacterium]|nr:polyphosphate kinase 2 family protein [Pseudomonadales bacterium]NNM11731.1 polyphosphate kinase 2 family protein [Pseudomonadales bacterium]RZV57762.1 MAG: polyphosphate kinase 2 family protein [Pseudomonadales bacterium]
MDDIDVKSYRYDGGRKFKLASCPTSVESLYEDKKDYKRMLWEYRKKIDELQNKMYAHDRYGMLLIFQAMDAAGKDGTIRHVMSGVNPHGVFVSAFKKPSDEELDHTYLWRSNRQMPARGRLRIFNRSYYEEVLVVKVHPEILARYQRVPDELKADPDKVWQQRYTDIRAMEQYESNNGIAVVKFFLNLSRDEQRRRFIDRIDRPEKNWKFSNADVKERAYWDDYMQAYEAAINQTACGHAPWYVIPADDKRNMRLIVSRVVLSHLQALPMHYPKVNDEQRAALGEMKKSLEND